MWCEVFVFSFVCLELSGLLCYICCYLVVFFCAVYVVVFITNE